MLSIIDLVLYDFILNITYAGLYSCQTEDEKIIIFYLIIFTSTTYQIYLT